MIEEESAKKIDDGVILKLDEHEGNNYAFEDRIFYTLRCCLFLPVVHSESMAIRFAIARRKNGD